MYLPPPQTTKLLHSNQSLYSGGELPYSQIRRLMSGCRKWSPIVIISSGLGPVSGGRDRISVALYLTQG